MFKKIPGNSKFLIDLFGNMKLVDGAEGCTPIVYRNQTKIEIYGRECIVDLDWLSLIAHFEVELPVGMESRIFDIHFTDTVLARKSVTNKMMLIRKPITIDRKYRVVPCFTQYAVSCLGELLEIRTKKKIAVNKHTLGGYSCVWIYNPETGIKENLVLHRLVASAWVFNNDYVTRPIINHKDGDKANFHAKNLEWVSHAENCMHAVNNGLRKDNVPCKVFDITDKSVKEFPSISQACRFMGVVDSKRIPTLLHRTRHKLINDRYQLKLSSDTSDWFYEKHSLESVAGRYTIVIRKETGEIEEHPDVRTFKRQFKVWNVSNIEDLINKARLLYPNWKFSYIDHYVLKPIQAYELATEKIIEAEGIRQMSRLINRAYSGIRVALLAGETRVFDGFAFRYKTDTPWDTNFTGAPSRSKCILATHLETCEVLDFDSERKAATHFKVDRSTIRNKAGNQKILHGYRLEYRVR